MRKTFICTDGYFAEISLNESDLVIDYDEYAEKEIPLEIVGSPEGAYKGVTAVFSEEGVIELRGGKFYAVGTSRNAVAVTLTAETYEGGSVSAEGRITVKRKAQTIDFAENSIVTLNKVYALSDSVAVSPSGPYGKSEIRLVRRKRGYRGPLRAWLLSKRPIPSSSPLRQTTERRRTAL